MSLSMREVAIELGIREAELDNWWESQCLEGKEIIKTVFDECNLEWQLKQEETKNQCEADYSEFSEE